MKPLYFTFEKVAALQLNTDWPPAASFFAAEYAYHAAPNQAPGLPILQVEISAHPQPGWTAHRHKGLAAWQYAIQFTPQRVTLQASGNRWGLPMIHHMLVHPSLRWLAANQGTLLLHAGGVVKNGSSILLTGEGGAGKTTTTSLALAAGGWQIHADDYVFLRPQEGSRAYVTRSHLYLSLLRWVPQVAQTLSLRERLQLEFFGRARAWSGEGLKWPVRLPVTRLWPQTPVAAQAHPAALLLLERAEPLSGAARLTPLDDSEAAAQRLLKMNFGEARHFLSLLKKARVFSPGWLQAWQDQELRLLRQLCQEIPLYRLSLPRAADAPTARQTLLPVLERLAAEHSSPGAPPEKTA